MTFVSVLEFPLPAGSDDWTESFSKAIQKATTQGHAGVLVPASPTPYTVRQPTSVFTPSIDLRGVHDFVLMGEGPRSVIAMVGPESWKLIHIGNDATDVVVRDLCLDGARATTTDDQAHLVQIGASANLDRGARRISVLNCTLRNAPGDGVAIVPASTTDRRDEVSDITISGCHFLGNRRSGVSNQRLAKRVSILHNRFEGTQDQDIDFEPTSNLPDSGPSGYLILGNTIVRSGRSVSVTLSGTSPEARSRVNTFAYNKIFGGRLGVHDAQDLEIIGNYIEAGPTLAGAVVLLSGAVERVLFADNTVVRPRQSPPGTLMNITSEQTVFVFDPDAPDNPGDPGDDPPKVDPATDTFIRKGHRLQTGTGPISASVAPTDTLPDGLDEGVDYWAIKVDDHKFRLATSPQNADSLVAVSLADSGSGPCSLIRHGFPRTVKISRNRLSTFQPLPAGERLVTITNASTVSFRDNDIASYAGVRLPIALKFEAMEGVRKRPLSGWDVVGNRFRGNAKLPPEFDVRGTGVFGVCVSMSAGEDVVRDVRVLDNVFSGCNNQVELTAGTAGDFVLAPQIAGNVGDNIPLVLTGVPAVLIGGNVSSSPIGPGAAPVGSHYCGRGDPGVIGLVAPVGSLYSRIDPASGPRLYINLDGNSAWKAVALMP